MSKMSLLGTAIRSKCFNQSSELKNRGLSLLLRDLPRPFSTEAEQPQYSSEQPQNSSFDPFLQTPTSGLVYGKLFGTNKHTLKTDIINFLEGCMLTLDDVKVDYDRSFMPFGMMLQFPSWNAFDHALKVIGRKGRLYRLDRADRYQWDILKPYNGKAVLLDGIPRSAVQDDIDRFLSGLEFDASSVQLLFRQAFPDTVKMAIVRFPSQAQAMNAFITKNRDFCLNNQISVRVLQ